MSLMELAEKTKLPVTTLQFIIMTVKSGEVVDLKSLEWWIEHAFERPEAAAHEIWNFINGSET